MADHRATVLIIDDDAAMRYIVAEALRDEGYAAVAVARHDDAPGALRATPADLILADPAGAGLGDPWPALERVRAAAGGTPVLIVSARPPDTLAGYADRGFAGLIAKPFTLDELLDAVRATLVARS